MRLTQTPTVRRYLRGTSLALAIPTLIVAFGAFTILVHLPFGPDFVKFVRYQTPLPDETVKSFGLLTFTFAVSASIGAGLMSLRKALVGQPG